MNVLTVRNLSLSFPGARAPVVDGVSFDVAAGECLAIVGESGAGKTLTARSLLGLTPGTARVSADELTVAGVDARGLSETAWRRLRGAAVGMVSQDALVSLDPLRRIGSEVAEPLLVHEPRLSPAMRGARVLELLAKVAMPQPRIRGRQYPHQLSGGLRQRALIASALAGKPMLLVADEPTTALDVTVQAKVLRLLGDLKDSGIGLLLISHDLAVVRSLADRIAVMHDGRFVETADARVLFEDPQHPYTRRLLAAATPSHRGPRVGSDGVVVLSARNLVKTYRRAGIRFRAVDGVDLDVHAGETVGIVGESGSGKTTVARMLLGIEKPDSGDVVLDGEPWSGVSEGRRRSRRARIQLVHQDALSAFDPRFTVRRILFEAIDLRGTARRDRHSRAVDLMEQVSLPGTLLERRPHELSGGQRQRVAIARALARRPGILVCDEPVSALDASVGAQVLELLGSLQAAMGLSLVFISHDLAVVRRLCDRVLVMKDGTVVDEGATEELFSHPRHPFTRELLAAIPTFPGVRAPGAAIRGC
jgi:peptide/nickel transport system ATP-binding protein